MFKRIYRKEILIPASAILLVIIIAGLLVMKLDSWKTVKDDSNYGAMALDMQTVTIDNEKYLPKNNTMVLFIGVDKFDNIDDFYTDDREQADFLSLAIFNHQSKEYRLIQINRDTMTYMNFLSSFDGSDTGRDIYMQIAVAHTMGNTSEKRNENTVDAVKKLFNNTLPLKHYFAFTMSAITHFNDALGGIDVKVDNKIADDNLGLYEGETVHLDGQASLDFIRDRADASNPTNVARMERQKAYMGSFLESFKNEDLKINVEELDKIEGYVDTDLDTYNIVDILTYVSTYTFKGLTSVSGTGGYQGEYATFIADALSITNILTSYCYSKRES